jgi:hypothetical protein
MELTNDYEAIGFFSFAQASLAYKDKDNLKVWNGRRDCKFTKIPIHVAMQ